MVKNIVAIIQARTNSIRLPNKILFKINNMMLIEILYKRLEKSKKINQIVIATTKKSKNLIHFLKKKKIKFFVGSEKNVLERYYKTASKFKADTIVRITADGILADPKLIDRLIGIYENKNVDYLSNIEPATFPDGLDIEIFNFKILKYANFNAKKKYDKEHVTPFIRSLNKKNKFNVLSKKDYSKLRLTLDEPEDFVLLQRIFNYFKPDIYFGWEKIVSLINKNKKYQVNSHIERNEGATMTKSNKLWKRAKKIIPGGNMLLSKRPELFHPKNWPAYYSKAKGIDVWDLDGKKYRDLSLMGIGCNILGYANDKIDGEVIKAIKKSNVTTLNCPEDIQLCEKLLELHPWADMARLARTGGEASAVAVRIARAASGKDKIAFCGYHGWHDWYLSANIGKNNNLQTHLMGGLEANGVPKNLKNTAFPFTYNNFNELEQIVNKNDIGAVKMEVSRNFKPENNFLQKVRKLCTKKKIILIFDECTSGFRQTFGGLHKLYDVNPDIAWFGKALGNGYSIAAIIGKREIMDCAQNSFISSTFWTERTGPVAALETLKQMEKIKSWEIITNKGLKIQKTWAEIANRNNLEIQVLGIPALSTFSIKSKEWIKYKTFITQEMLKKKYLATNALFVSIKHDDATLENYFDILDGIFNKISKFENKSLSVDKYIEGPVCQTGFQRLN
jgi:glutamate-1-semialdehyde aminotransferase/spore coat polysaccharide biosynthesis protein SpsF (cytidylyltransferase family)